MDLSQTWKKLEKEKLETPIEGDLRKNDQSRHPVAQLKRNYFLKTIAMSFFVVCFAIAFAYFDHLLIKGALLILVAAYVTFLLASYSMYKNIRTDLSMDGSLIKVLTETRDTIARALRLETISSLMISPFAGVAGYLGGYSLTGGSIDKIFHDPTQIAIMAILMVVSTIAGYFLGRRLTREGYGKSLQEISRMIGQLKS
jgi:hypothetical protein